MRFRKHWFFLFYFLLGLGYLVLTGPFRAPDERNHFFRSYEISEARLRPFRGELWVGDNLPSSLMRLSDALGSHANHRIEPAQQEAARALQLVPQAREFIEFSTAVYSPLAYIPSAISIALGRLLGAGPFSLIYFARVGNLLVGSWLIALALSYAGYARWPALLVAMFPMTISQIATVSADAMSYGLTFLWISLVMNTALGKSGTLSTKRLVGLIALALALSQLRPPYPLLGFLVLLIPARRFEKAHAILICSAIIMTSLLPAVAWNRAVAGLFQSPVVEQRIDPAEQLRWVLMHPGMFWHRAKQDLKKHGSEYWEQLVGRLGWLNIRLPSWIPIGFAAALAAAIFTAPRDGPFPTWRQRLSLSLAVFGGVMAIQFMLYLTFNPIGSPFIVGVQGRYFTAIALLAAFAVSNPLLSRPSDELVGKVGFLLFIASAHSAAFVALAQAAGKM